MDQYSISRAKTFVLKTNIHCKGCEKKIKKLLKDVGGVDKISIDAAQGKIQILGSIDPHKVLKLLDKHGNKSEILWEPAVMESISHVVPTPQSSRRGTSHYHHIDHDNTDLVVHLKKMSEIKSLRCVEVSEEGMKLTFRKYDQKGKVYDGQNDSFFARNSNGTAMHMTDHGDQHAKSNINPADGCPSCSRNKAMYTHASYCNGSQDNAPVEGIPWPGYIKPSAPPLVQMPQYYSPAPPSYEYMQQASYNINHPVFSAFSDENPNSCIIM